MPHRLAQQRMTWSDFNWTFHAIRSISAVADLFVFIKCDRLVHHYFINVSVISRILRLSRHICLCEWRHRSMSISPARRVNLSSPAWRHTRRHSTSVAAAESTDCGTQWLSGRSLKLDSLALCCTVGDKDEEKWEIDSVFAERCLTKVKWTSTVNINLVHPSISVCDCLFS